MTTLNEVGTCRIRPVEVISGDRDSVVPAEARIAGTEADGFTVVLHTHNRRGLEVHLWAEKFDTLAGAMDRVRELCGVAAGVR